MNSREIIIQLIDKGVIDGEQAAILFNDVFQSELLEAWKALNNKENHDLAKDVLNDKGGYRNTSPWTINPNTWGNAVTTATPLSTSYSVTANTDCISVDSTKTK